MLMGYKKAAGAGKAKSRSPAKPLAKAAAAKTKPLPKGPLGGVRKPWLKLRITRAKNPERAYIQGTKEVDVKPYLIVQVTRKSTPHYKQVIDEIYCKLEKDWLSKAEALKLREELCTPWL